MAQGRWHLSGINKSLSHIYNPRQKSWHACRFLQYLSRKFYKFAPSPQSQQRCLSRWIRHCPFPTLSGGRGFLILVMPLVIVSKIACQSMFQLSDTGVPRTFVEDCICVTKRDNDMLSGQSCWRAFLCCFHTIFYDVIWESRRSWYDNVFAGPGFALCSLHNIFHGRLSYKQPSCHSPAFDWSNSSCVVSRKLWLQLYNHKLL